MAKHCGMRYSQPLMRTHAKRVLRILRLGPAARTLRHWCYATANAVAGAGFRMLRGLGFLPGDRSFDKGLVKKILIVRVDRIGDVVLSTPAFRAVRESFPESEIHLLVREYTEDLVLNNASIDKMLVHHRDALADDYDLAIALHPGFVPNRLVFSAGAAWRVGYGGRGGDFFLTHKLRDDRAARVRHEVESVLEIVGLVGCETEDMSLVVSVTEEGEAFVRHFLRENDISAAELIVVIHPGARQEYIRWTKEGFAEVADRLIREKEAKVILIGTRDEESLVAEVMSLMKETAICAVGTALTEVVSVIKSAKLFVGNSTGPMHIAAALGVPVVAVFGSNHPLDSQKAWRPWHVRCRAVSTDDDRFKQHPSDYDVSECMESISADAVFSAASQLLAESE